MISFRNKTIFTGKYYSCFCTALLHQSSCFFKNLFVMLLTCTLVWSIHLLFLSVIHHAGWHATLIRDIRILLNTYGVYFLYCIIYCKNQHFGKNPYVTLYFLFSTVKKRKFSANMILLVTCLFLMTLVFR